MIIFLFINYNPAFLLTYLTEREYVERSDLYSPWSLYSDDKSREKAKQDQRKDIANVEQIEHRFTYLINAINNNPN